MVRRDPAQEKEVLEWIEACIGEKLSGGAYEDVLRDGVAICKLMNKLNPGSVSKIQTSGGHFKLRENIERFQKAAKQYGVPEEEIFQTADLYDRRNIPQVTLSLYALARLTQKHPEWKGPGLGPKMADECKREFSEEQLRADQGFVGLQMGQNKGATQSGHGGFGNVRHM